MTDRDETRSADEEPTVSLSGGQVPRRPSDEPTVSLNGDEVPRSGETPDTSPDPSISAAVPAGVPSAAPVEQAAAGPVVEPTERVEQPAAGPVVEPTEPVERPVAPDAVPDDTPGAVPEKSDLEPTAASGSSGVSLGIRRPAPAGTLIWVLLALLGFTLVVQLRSNDADHGLATARQEDLVRILSDLEAQDSRLLSDIQGLESTRQQLSSGVQGRETALLEASKRSEELGLLAGTLPGRGPGLEILLDRVKASDVLNAVQELRGARGEVMQISGANGVAVRVVASSYFVDASGGGIIADGEHLTGPFRLLVIGQPETMRTALQIPGGVVASVQNDGGSVTMDSRSLVEVTEVRKAANLQYARPVS